MTVTVVNEWYFKDDGDKEEGLAAAAEYVAYMKAHDPQLLLSLWLKDRDNPLHFFHITMFESYEAFLNQRQSEGTRRFTERLYPEIRRDDSFKAPVGDVVLSSGGTLEVVEVG